MSAAAVRRAGPAAWLVALLLWLLAALAPAWAQAPVPQLTGRVVDTTGTLPAEAVSRIERQLAELESATGSQVAVLMVGTTDGEPIEGYAVRVFEDWQLGRKGVDDGVLLVVARDDRAMRIEVGYGLEGAITDAQSSRLIREHITPRFAEGDFAGGIQAGVDGLAALVRKEPLPPPAASAGEDDGRWEGLFLLALVALFVSPVVLTVIGAVLGAMLLPGLGAWLGALAGGALGAVVGLVLSVTGIRQAVRKASRKGGGGGPGGWGGGGRGGGGGWGGGGGFGGGGGRSGGGGASGRW